MAKRMKNKAGKAAERVLEAEAEAAERLADYEESAFVRALSLVADLGDQPPMRALCAATVAAGVFGGKPRLARAGLRMILAHTAATEAKDFVKLRVDRRRPRSLDGQAKDAEAHKPAPGRDSSKEETSFPSGHSAGAIAVAQAYAREFPEHRGWALAGAGALALAQIPRCAHYPTDVGAGLALGLASEAAVDAAFEPLIALLPEALVDAFQLSGEEPDE